MNGSVFLTGATGFIGSGMLKKWLVCSDREIVVLARARRDRGAGERVRQGLAQAFPGEDPSRYMSRVRVVEGDLSARRLGFADEDYQRLTGTISQIVHCGAAVRFDLELEDARKTNVRGTEAVLALGRDCANLTKLDYIGTAYVAGKRRGLVREDELDEGQEHNNTYERSKLEAEKRVRQAMEDLPITIFRPSIVVSDSKTGRISPHAGFARVLKMYVAGVLKALPGNASTPVDLVPLDYAVDAVSGISGNDSSKGKCFHLCAGPDRTTTLQEVSELVQAHFGGSGFAIIPPEQFHESLRRMQGSLSTEEQEMLAELEVYLPYLTGNLTFDDSNTRQALRGTGTEVPRLASYFGKLADFLMKSQ